MGQYMHAKFHYRGNDIGSRHDAAWECPSPADSGGEGTGGSGSKGTESSRGKSYSGKDSSSCGSQGRGHNGPQNTEGQIQLPSG